MRPMFRGALAVAIVGGMAMGLSRAADDAPKYTIKQVMKKAHKDGLLKKVVSGQGSKEDAMELLDLYKALSEDKPPKGELADWKTRTAAIVLAAQEVVDNKEGAKATLEKAVNCAECHKLHKGG